VAGSTQRLSVVPDTAEAGLPLVRALAAMLLPDERGQR
jgi:hypothetical protein